MSMRSITRRRAAPAPVRVRPRSIAWLASGPGRYVTWGRDRQRNMTIALAVELVGPTDWRATVGSAVNRPDVLAYSRIWLSREAAMDWCWCAIDPEAATAAIRHQIVTRHP